MGNYLDPVAHVMAQGAQQTVAVQSLRHAPRAWKPGADAVLDHFSATGIVDHSASRVDLATGAGFGFLGVGVTDDGKSNSFAPHVRRFADVLKLAGMAYAGVALRTAGHAPLLTKREAHVLTLFAQGLTLREIAENDQKSVSTVRQQLASARRRLGARNATHAASLAGALGFIRVSR